MTISELKALIAGLPDHLEVYVHDPDRDGFTHSTIDKGALDDVALGEDPDGPVLCKQSALVLTLC